MDGLFWGLDLGLENLNKSVPMLVLSANQMRTANGYPFGTRWRFCLEQGCTSSTSGIPHSRPVFAQYPQQGTMRSHFLLMSAIDSSWVATTGLGYLSLPLSTWFARHWHSSLGRCARFAHYVVGRCLRYAVWSRWMIRVEGENAQHCTEWMTRYLRPHP